MKDCKAKTKVENENTKKAQQVWIPKNAKMNG